MFFKLFGGQDMAGLGKAGPPCSPPQQCSPSQPRWVVQRSAAPEDTQPSREAGAGRRAEAGLSPHPCIPPASTSLLAFPDSHVGPKQERSKCEANRGVTARMLYRWSSEKSCWSSLGVEYLPLLPKRAPLVAKDSGWEMCGPLGLGRGLPPPHEAWKGQGRMLMA